MKYLSVGLIILLTVSTGLLARDDCYLVVAGRLASAEGHVLMAHNEDNGTDKVFRFRRVERAIHAIGDSVELEAGGRIAQVDTTWAYIVCEMPGMDFSHVLLNEHSVAVVSNNCPSREDRPELYRGGVGPRLRWLVAERAATAREGVRLVGDLVQKFGYVASGRTLTICDPSEAWQVAMVNGMHWVAQRVPDDEVSVLANSYGIHAVDLADTLNFLGSADLITYARSRGWYDPSSDGAFDFEKAYARVDCLEDPAQRMRQWIGYRHLAGRQFDLPEKGNSLPFSIKPGRPVTRQNFCSVLRDHYEGTLFEADWGSSHSTPLGRYPRTVCHGTTNHGDVFELKEASIEGTGSIWWTSLWRPCASPFVPLFLEMDGIPTELYCEVPPEAFTYPATAVMPDQDKAVGLFVELTLAIDRTGWKDMKEIRSRWMGLENKADQEVATASSLEAGERGEKLFNLTSGLLFKAMAEARLILSKIE